VISVAVRWYLRYGLSYRDVEELLAERGITVDHVTIYRWVQRFTPEFVDAAVGGRTCTGRSISMGKSSTCGFPSDVTRPLRLRSSLGR
jgi:transposase-like protein